MRSARRVDGAAPGPSRRCRQGRLRPICAGARSGVPRRPRHGSAGATAPPERRGQLWCPRQRDEVGWGWPAAGSAGQGGGVRSSRHALRPAHRPRPSPGRLGKGAEAGVDQDAMRRRRPPRPAPGARRFAVVAGVSRLRSRGDDQPDPGRLAIVDLVRFHHRAPGRPSLPAGNTRGQRGRGDRQRHAAGVAGRGRRTGARPAAGQPRVAGALTASREGEYRIAEGADVTVPMFCAVPVTMSVVPRCFAWTHCSRRGCRRTPRHPAGRATHGARARRLAG